jgi:hypothetical protein
MLFGLEGGAHFQKRRQAHLGFLGLKKGNAQ